MLRAGDADALTPSCVDTALHRIVVREDPAYTQLWTGLTLNQKKALKAVIGAGGVGLLSAATLARVDLAASSLQRALEALEERHIVRVDPAGGTSTYVLIDPFLAFWLEQAQAV
jgi:hypothetical protein